MIATQPFWRSEPFSKREIDLLNSLGDAHRACALRGNLSHVAVELSAVGSGDFGKSISAALMTLGDLHAPVTQCYEFLVSDTYPPDGKVPGWGNSFIKGRPDPAWEVVDVILCASFPSIYARIKAITQWLHDKGKPIYPNPGCYTAACAIGIGMPSRIASYLFIASRLEKWTEAFMNKTQEESVLA